MTFVYEYFSLVQFLSEFVRGGTNINLLLRPLSSLIQAIWKEAGMSKSSLWMNDFSEKLKDKEMNHSCLVVLQGLSDMLGVGHCVFLEQGGDIINFKMQALCFVKSLQVSILRHCLKHGFTCN